MSRRRHRFAMVAAMTNNILPIVPVSLAAARSLVPIRPVQYVMLSSQLSRGLEPSVSPMQSLLLQLSFLEFAMHARNMLIFAFSSVSAVPVLFLLYCTLCLWLATSSMEFSTSF